MPYQEKVFVTQTFLLWQPTQRPNSADSVSNCCWMLNATFKVTSGKGIRFYLSTVSLCSLEKEMLFMRKRLLTAFLLKSLSRKRKFRVHPA